MTRLVEQARRAATWFNAGDDYTAVFTQNATAALKHVGESYPFARWSLLLTADNHNSVNGIREFACAEGALVVYAPLTTPELRLDHERLRELAVRADPSAGICSPTPRSRISPASGIHSNWSRRRMPPDGMCCWTRRRMCRRRRWISAS